MSEPAPEASPSRTSYPADTDVPGTADAGPAALPARPADPERGLRGVMSAVLILEAITILLGIRVVQQLGTGGQAMGTAGVVVIAVLAAAHVGACALVRRRVFLPVLLGLQAALIACWVFSPSVGITGIVFAVVWAIILGMRREFRRRLADGTMPGRAPSGAAGDATGPQGGDGTEPQDEGAGRT